jgi:hypothetical protein
VWPVVARGEDVCIRQDRVGVKVCQAVVECFFEVVVCASVDCLRDRHSTSCGIATHTSTFHLHLSNLNSSTYAFHLMNEDATCAILKSHYKTYTELVSTTSASIGLASYRTVLLPDCILRLSQPSSLPPTTTLNVCNLLATC